MVDEVLVEYKGVTILQDEDATPSNGWKIIPIAGVGDIPSTARQVIAQVHTNELNSFNDRN